MVDESVAHKTAKTAFWGAVEKFFSMGVQFVVGMVLARLLEPSDYGVVALMSVFFAIAGSIGECGFSNALIRKEKCTQSDYSTAFIYNVTVNTVLYGVIFLFAPYIADFYNQPILCPLMRVSGLSMIICSANITQFVQITRKLEFKKNAIITMVTSIVSGVIGIIAAYNGLGCWALVIQSVTAKLTGTIVLISIVRWKPTLEFSMESFKYLFGFGSKMLVTGIISVTYSNIYSIVIGKFYSPEALGLFNRGNGLAQLFPKIVESIFTRSTLPIMAQLQSDREHMLKVYRKFVVLVSFINIPACLLLAALAEPFILFFLTEKWIGAVIFVRIFCLAMILDPAGAINLNIFQVEGRSDITLKLEIVKKTIGFTTVFVLAQFSPLVLAVGSTCYVFFAFSLNLFYVNKLEKIPYTQQICDLLPCFFASAGAALVAYSITFCPIHPLLQLLIGVLCGLATYIFITKKLFRMEVYEYALSFIRKRQ